MYKPPQKKNSSWTPTTVQNKGKSPSKLGHSIQPKAKNKSSKPQDIGKYSRDSSLMFFSFSRKHLLVSPWLKKLSSVAVGALLFQVGISLPVQAVTLVTQRDDLIANDKLDWSSLGFGNPSEFPTNQGSLAVNFLPNYFQTTSEKGLGLSVDIPVIPNPRLTSPFVVEVSPILPINFSNGDDILFSGFIPGGFPAEGNPGPLTITFDTPVQGVGTQIAVDDTLSFTLFISAFDEQNNLLGSFSAPGVSKTIIDNSATFLGVSSNSANISRIVISSSETNRAFGINDLSINQTDIPESSNLVALGLLGIGVLASKKKIVP
ncbi:hypothetical protein [Coleofasciculus sp.]|uniref:hypothetical protein n=1 Tax=Coleofasciculus sp. TaxID=3100458 RepID=UPI003A472800